MKIKTVLHTGQLESYQCATGASLNSPETGHKLGFIQFQVFPEAYEQWPFAMRVLKSQENFPGL